jgi:hypothetical protein
VHLPRPLYPSHPSDTHHKREAVGRAAAEYARPVLGDRDALVLEVRRFDIHGAGFVDVTVVFGDRSTASARLGAESVPLRIAPGDRVTVSLAMNMIVEIRGAEDQDRS